LSNPPAPETLRVSRGARYSGHPALRPSGRIASLCVPVCSRQTGQPLGLIEVFFIFYCSSEHLSNPPAPETLRVSRGARYFLTRSFAYAIKGAKDTCFWMIGKG
jgi:hypothetical protein